MKRIMIVVLGAAACTSGHSERYGFVTVLGRDTVAVERIARAPDSFVSDEVDQ